MSINSHCTWLHTGSQQLGRRERLHVFADETHDHAQLSSADTARPYCAGPGCQHSGALGGPQAKPLLPHADAIFPAAFCLAVGALCQANWLPFWLLLAAILPTFIAGLHFIVFKGGHQISSSK